MSTFIIGALLLGAYFLPTIVAGMGSKAASGGIFILNLLLGWTILGWVAALIWSVTGETEAERARRY